MHILKLKIASRTQLKLINLHIKTRQHFDNYILAPATIFHGGSTNELTEINSESRPHQSTATALFFNLEADGKNEPSEENA